MSKLKREKAKSWNVYVNNTQERTSQPAFKKSPILDIATKYAMCGFPVVAVPQ